LHKQFVDAAVVVAIDFEGAQGFANNVDHTHAWVKRTCRVLKHSLHSAAELFVQFLAQWLSFKLHNPGCGRFKVEQHASQGGFARARLAKNAKVLSACDVERDTR
jgi:hypothetical protein